MERVRRDPRVRPVVIVLLCLAAFALVWHAVGMADHAGPHGGDPVMLSVCLAALLLVVLVVPGTGPRGAPVRADVGHPISPPPLPVGAAPSRHPPDEGVVLRR